MDPAPVNFGTNLNTYLFSLNCALHDISVLNTKRVRFSTFFLSCNYSTRQTVWDIWKTDATGPEKKVIRFSPIRKKYYERPRISWGRGCCLKFEQPTNHVLRSCYHVDIPFKYNKITIIKIINRYSWNIYSKIKEKWSHNIRIRTSNKLVSLAEQHEIRE